MPGKPSKSLEIFSSYPLFIWPALLRRQWRRRACGLLIRQLLFRQQLRADINNHQLAQIVRWLIAARFAGDPGQIPRDLHRRQDQPPRNAPPAEKKRKRHRPELPLHPARFAAYPRCARPSCENEHRPYLMKTVHVHRAELVAYGTIPAPNLLHAPVDLIRRNVFGHAQNESVLVTSPVAKPLPARRDPTEKNR